MVTQDGDLLVGRVVVGDLLVNNRPQVLLCRLIEEAVERDRCVVRTKHLDAEPWHLLFEELVQHVGVQLAEQLVVGLLPFLVEAFPKLLLEDLHVLVDVFLYLDGVLISDRVLTEEVKLDVQVVHELHILHLEVAAADSVGLIVVLLVPRTERQLVDEVHRRPHLRLFVVLCLGKRLILPLDSYDVVLEHARLLILLTVRLRLEAACGCQPHVLELARVHGVLPERQPGDGVVVPDLLPLPALVHLRQRGHGRLLPDVDGDILGVDTLLQPPHLRVLPAAPEKTRRLHAEVANLFGFAIDDCSLVWGFKLLLLLLSCFFLLRGELLLGGFFLLLPSRDVLKYGGEVALIKILHPLVFPRLGEDLAEVLPEVFAERGLLEIVRLRHARKHCRNLLLVRREVHLPAIIPHLHSVRLILWRKHDAAVLERRPLGLCLPTRLGCIGRGLARAPGRLLLHRPPASVACRSPLLRIGPGFHPAIAQSADPGRFRTKE
mmetsp:Transcript_31018/g.73741  ORF Transcript_31018/g.73741 Transcript_31018/m.73741 type:complete len:491 (-) Transcript_31018:301-1773(-)